MIKTITYLPLEFKFPIKEKLKIVTSYPDFADFTIEFQHIKMESRVKQSKTTQEKVVSLAKIEWSPNLNISNSENDNVVLEESTYSILFYINLMIDSIKFTQKKHHIKRIMLSDLPEIIEIEYNNKLFQYVTSPLKTINSEFEINKDELRKSLDLMNDWMLFPRLETVDRLYINAMYFLYREEFIFTILQLQTSFEVFIKMCLENIDSKKFKQIIKNTPFRNIIEHNLSKALDVDLNYEKNKIIKEWKKNLYDLRNDIIHKGRIHIKGVEAYAAYDSYVAAREYLTKKMEDKGFFVKLCGPDLDIFIKNHSTYIDPNEVNKRLLEKGFIDNDSSIEVK